MFSFNPSSPSSLSGCDGMRLRGMRGRSSGLSRLLSRTPGSFFEPIDVSEDLLPNGLVLRGDFSTALLPNGLELRGDRSWSFRPKGLGLRVLSWPLCLMGGKEDLTFSSAVNLSPCIPTAGVLKTDKMPVGLRKNVYKNAVRIPDCQVGSQMLHQLKLTGQWTGGIVNWSLNSTK